jgi:hypothetical protein
MEFGFYWSIEFDHVTLSIHFGYDQAIFKVVGIGAIAKIIIMKEQPIHFLIGCLVDLAF